MNDTILNNRSDVGGRPIADRTRATPGDLNEFAERYMGTDEFMILTPEVVIDGVAMRFALAGFFKTDRSSQVAEALNEKLKGE
jgi:hypothetical protein